MINNKFYYGIVREDESKKESDVDLLALSKLLTNEFIKGYCAALLDHGYSYSQIASEMGMHESAVRSLLREEESE